MNKLNTTERVQVIRALVECNSIASTVRMTGIAKTTILRLVKSMGEACQKFHDDRVRGLTTRRIQCDELWAFCQKKAAQVPVGQKGVYGIGDTWTWTAIDADSKLMVTWLVGLRDGRWAKDFMDDVADRLTHRIQLTTDGLKAYLDAVEQAFGGASGVDYAQLIKIYGEPRQTEARYSPPICLGTEEKHICGAADSRHISTSYVERSNLTVRMGIRRYTRLTNAFSKKIENHIHHTAIYFCYYNWCRIHQTLRVTPAMEAGLTTKLWEIEDLVALMD